MTIAETINNCVSCPLSVNFNGKKVIGHGNKQSSIAIIGEAPGETEVKYGIPFVGKAGQALNQILLDNGIRRDTIFTTNVIKCRPFNNRTPYTDEIEACLPNLMLELSYVKPKYILVLGATALKAILGYNGINKWRGSWYDWGTTKCFPTFHPSYVLEGRDNWEKNLKTLKMDIAKFLRNANKF